MVTGTPLVVVTRDGCEWQAEIRDLATAYRAASLPRIDRWVRDVLGLRATGWVPYRFRTGNLALDGLIRDARRAREAAQLTEAQARQATRTLLEDAPQHADLSIRDLAVLLGLSHQRIQQLRS